jgi:hypothetical protein
VSTDALAGLPEAMTFPKRFDWLDAPPEILKLVDQLMPLLLAGEHPTLEILRDQLRVSRVRSVELSGVGFFAEFEVPVDAVTVTPSRIVGGDAKIELVGVEHGAGCVLFVDSGRLAMLEGYSYGGEPWLETTAVIAVSDVFSLEHALRRAPAG